MTRIPSFNSWLVCLALLCSTVNAFVTVGGRTTTQSIPSIRETRSNDLITCHLVTEDDVLKAVEKAETLWADALEARKTANALSDRAEEEAEASAETANQMNAVLQARGKETPISMQQLAEADAAARSSLDAGSMVQKALKASDEADRLEKLAEQALQDSEAQLEQHLQDFPDSPLAQ